MEKKAINIFQYTNYRQFLADIFNYKKEKNPGYSYRVFSRKAGVGSASHFKMVVDGLRNLSQKTIPKYAQGLDLDEREKKYFELLVLYDQTVEEKLKAEYFAEIIKLRASENTLHKLELEKYSFLSQWYYVAIYELIGTRDFLNNPAWILARLGNRIGAKEVKTALKNLEDLKLIEKDKRKGYIKTAGSLTTDDNNIKSESQYFYHSNMIGLSVEALNDPTLKGIRELSGVTFAIAREKIPLVIEKIQNFRKEINKLSDSFKNTEEVYQLNLHFFPLTKKPM